METWVLGLETSILGLETCALGLGTQDVRIWQIWTQSNERQQKVQKLWFFLSTFYSYLSTKQSNITNYKLTRKYREHLNDILLSNLFFVMQRQQTNWSHQHQQTTWGHPHLQTTRSRLLTENFWTLDIFSCTLVCSYIFIWD